jgi:HPt (histidine-containing phosphotransfer) domain-containing protein
MFLENSFDDFLSKPIVMAELNAMLERWIPSEKQEAAGQTSGAEGGELYIPGLNAAKGLMMTGGSAEAYLRTLSVFYRENSRKVREADGFVKEENAAPYKLYVHSLRSALASVGSEEMPLMAERLERAAEDNDWDFIRERGGRFLDELRELLNNIKTVLDERTVAAEVNKAELNAELTALLLALNDYDIAGINAVCNKLHVYSGAEGIGGLIDELLMHRINGDYEEAAVVAEVILKM